MFSIGDKILYPMYGAGIIESIEEKEVLGEKKKYYIMKIPIDNMRVMIPMDLIHDFGIRRIIGYNEFGNVINIFKQSGDIQTDTWSKRYRYNMDKIKKGDIYEVAEVVKDFMIKENKKGLSPGEKKILENAERILYSELILSTGMTFDEIKKLVLDAIDKS
jgi:CarD family transcriptional regulator